MSSLSTQPYKGTRDFYPEDKRIQKYIFAKWREVAERYGYEEYDAPLIEPLALYKAKTGEEIVNEQTYTFVDRGEREVTIRPEMTPSTARMVAGRRQELGYPLRWYSIPNVWRYERPQKGRLREHWQLNVDIFGVTTIDAEIELITMAHNLMESFGAKDDTYIIRVNSRALMAEIMSKYLGLDSENVHRLSKLLDRYHKMEEQVFWEEAVDILGGRSAQLKELLAAKSMQELSAEITNSTTINEISALFNVLHDRGLKNVVFDISLMRGFDYYTDIVFEVFDTNPTNSRSIFGGGRYDGLVGLFGVPDLPAAGFGVGDVTMRDFLETHKLLPDLKPATQVYVVVIGDYLHEAQQTAAALRAKGLNVAVDITGRKIDQQIKAAVKHHVPYVLFVGEKEVTSRRYVLKNLTEQSEQTFSINEIATILAKQ